MKLHIEYIEENISNLKRENKLLLEKSKITGDKNDIINLKNDIKNLKELNKQMQNENSKKEKEFNDLIVDLKKKITEYEEILKGLQIIKNNNFTKNNFYYSVNNNTGNMILNNVNNNSNIGNIKISEFDPYNENTTNQEKFVFLIIK
jgi:hypothetical protein